MWGIIFRGLLTLLRSLGARGGAAGVRNTVAVSRFGRVAFTGLIRNRPLSQLTHQEVRNAMAQAGMREAHNAHFVSRLIERGSHYGIHTLDDLARALNNGVARAGKQPGTIDIVFPSGRAAATINSQGHFITFLPL